MSVAACTGTARASVAVVEKAMPVARPSAVLFRPVPARALQTRRAARTQVLRSSQRQVQASAVATETEIAELNKKFGIPGHVEVKAGRGGLPTVVLKHACGASAEVVLFGGAVTSWKQASGDEVLYIRPDAVFDKSKPISGGVPHCFPQFGPGAMQQHGFARNLDWAIASTSADAQPDDRDPEVTIVLTDNDYTRAMFPYAFKVAFSVSLHGEALRTDMRVINTDDKPFDFTAALHSYFEVSDVHKAAVRGLKGLSYLDKTVDANNPPTKSEDRDAITFTGPMDSVYLGAKDFVQLDVGTGAAVAITSSNWSEVVVWSPWTAMEACYKEFVCVENAAFGKPQNVQPGKDWRAQTEFSVKDL